VLVLDGNVQLSSDAGTVDAEPGALTQFEPGERHSLVSAGGARVLLVLAPWPADGHYPAAA
jgi:quercetin dioxygenase-like cupin family protein